MAEAGDPAPRRYVDPPRVVAGATNDELRLKLAESAVALARARRDYQHALEAAVYELMAAPRPTERMATFFGLLALLRPLEAPLRQRWRELDHYVIAAEQQVDPLFAIETPAAVDPFDAL